MQCLKCGRETRNQEVFCPECLETMAASPVNPDTPITLPHRDAPGKKPPARKQAKPEDVIAQLRKAVKRLRIAVVILAILSVVAAGGLAFLLYQSYTVPAIGSNYQTVSTDSTGQ